MKLDEPASQIHLLDQTKLVRFLHRSRGADADKSIVELHTAAVTSMANARKRLGRYVFNRPLSNGVGLGLDVYGVEEWWFDTTEKLVAFDAALRADADVLGCAVTAVLTRKVVLDEKPCSAASPNMRACP